MKVANSLVALIFLTLVGGTAVAKGTDELTPTNDATEPEPESEAAEAQEAAEAVPDVNGEANSEQGAMEAVAVTRSSVSKHLDNKLNIGTGIHFSMITGEGGNWNGGFANEVTVTYRLPWSLSGFSLSGQFRYSAIDVTPEIEKRAYRGVVEGYHAGAVGEFNLNEKLVVYGIADLGIVKTAVEPLDVFEKDSDLEGMGFNVGLGGGADWVLTDKIKAGPKVILEFGTYTVAQIGGQATFSF